MLSYLWPGGRHLGGNHGLWHFARFFWKKISGNEAVRTEVFSYRWASRLRDSHESVIVGRSSVVNGLAEPGTGQL